MHQTTDQVLELSGPDPRARALRWYLGHLRTGWQNAGEDDVRRAYRSDDPVPPAQRLRFAGDLAARVPALDLDGVAAIADHQAIARLHDAQGRGWRVRAIMHPPEPERLRWAFLTQEPPPGVVIRSATSADGPALAALERRVPVVDGAFRRTYDRGLDYFTAAAVADEHHEFVAETDGVLSGMASQVHHPTRAAGRLLRVAYARHVRVDPKVQGRGVFSALNGVAAESAIPYCDAPWSLTGMSNDAIDRRGMRNVARSPAVQLRVDVRSLSSPMPLPNPPSSADAEAIADFLAQGTRDLELSRPWSANEVCARVEGVGCRYGWDRLAFTGGALLGVERTPVTVKTEGPDGISVRREVLAFDVASVPGCESQIEDLVRAWCARLAEEGIDDLLITVGSPLLRQLLEPLASHSITFNLNHQFSVASDADERGYFIDGMLF